MTIRIVRLGTERSSEEGLRIGTVRRPPRGVPKTEYASRDYYDVWLPNLAPSQELMGLGKAVELDCHTAQTSRWAATVRSNLAATDPCFGSSCPSAARISTKTRSGTAPPWR
jgi:uncharacterized protein YeaO (DUF488 family)